MAEDLNVLARLEKYDRAIMKAHASTSDEESIRLAELAALVEAGLGQPLGKAKFAQLAAIQNKLHRTQAELVSGLDRGLLDEKTYLERLKTALRQAATESKELLGQEQFTAIFGAAGEHPEGLLEDDV